MMLIVAMTGDIQVTPRGISKGFEEMEEHFRWHIPHFFPLEIGIPNNPVSSTKIQQTCASASSIGSANPYLSIPLLSARALAMASPSAMPVSSIV